MFSKNVKRIAAGFMVVVVALILTGCGADEVSAAAGIPQMIMEYVFPTTGDQDTNYVFVMTPRANSADPDEKFLQEYAEEAAERGVNVSVVTVCSDPHVVSSHEIDERRDGITDVAARKIIKNQAKEIISWISESKAETEEADLFKAFTLAGQEAKRSGAKYSKVIVSDSGLSTAGLMIFNTAALDGRITGEEVLRSLREKEVLPDLEGVEIVWQGAGACKAPQMDLYTNNQKNVKSIWKTVLEGCGAKVEFAKGVSSKLTDSSEYPFVTTVVATSPGNAMDLEGISDFSELCRFKPGSPELLTSETEVIKGLDKYVEYMEKNSSYRLMIVGTTASADTAEVLASLSKARCETIRTLLVKAGVDPARIETVGLGYEPVKFCIRDTDENGNFVEELGKKNRRVLLMSADHEEAANIRALAVS